MARTPPPGPSRITRKQADRRVVKEEQNGKNEKKGKKGKKGKKEKKPICWKDEEFVNDVLGVTDDWEYAVRKIDTVERFPGRGPRRGFVYFRLFEIWGGDHVRVPLRLAKRRFPLKMMSFYESQVNWKTEEY
ncbi:hypothetical protein PQX77_008785 [Marasmius sp. AFHP31]|nr:hypothetical protein PQX77_008785 [Marasmius sp. AFHP31]